MTRLFITSIALGLAAFGLAACNAGSLLKTGSLTASPAPAAPKPATPIDRALHVAATSARAQKCGFYFDVAALRTNFLTSETTRGTPLETMTKVGQSYDYTASKVFAAIEDSGAYCTKNRTATIKKSLQKTLAGNFDPPVKKVAANPGILGNILDADAEPQPFDRDKAFDPNRRY